jgi:signal peptidase II
MNRNKFVLPVIIVVLVLGMDQWVKYYIKTHFYLGEEVSVVGNWFKLHFTENYGMAFGLEFGGKSGKIMLTVFRVLAVSAIGYYISTLIRKGVNTGYTLSWTLILAGAVGNIIDSIFYGVWFGYDTWFHGRVVDMFYFPIIQTTIPESFPFWKGEDFEFFRPVFNVADAAISIGFVLLLIFQRSIFKAEESAGKLELNNSENPVEQE